MFTAKDYAIAVIIEHLEKEHAAFSLDRFSSDMIYESSSVAVAAEYLELLSSPEDIAYASTRAGIVKYARIDGETKILSMRDMLELLEKQ